MSEKKTPVVTYVRVSKRDPGKQSFDSQIHAIQQFCHARSFRVLRSYSDRITGSQLRRSGLDKLLDDLRGNLGRHCHAVVVYKLCRLSRGGIFDCVKTVLQLKDLGVNLVSVTEPYDTSTAFGRLFFSICASFGEIELERHAERVVSGLQAARERGVVLGRRPVQITPEDLAKAVDLRMHDWSWRDIANELQGRYKVGTLRNRVQRALARDMGKRNG